MTNHRTLTASDTSPGIIENADLKDAVVSLIENADEFVYIVSPFVKSSEWRDLHDAIERAVRREVRVVLVARPWRNIRWDRESMRASVNELRGLGVRIHDAPKLHAKLYVSDREAIVGSFNLWKNKIPTIDMAVRLRDRRSRERCLEFARDPSQHGGEPRGVRRQRAPDDLLCSLCHCARPTNGHAHESRTCAGWFRTVDSKLREIALQVTNVALDVFGSSLRTRCRRQYFCANGDGDSGQLFRLVARGDHIELRVPTDRPDRAHRHARELSLDCRVDSSVIAILVGATGEGDVVERIGRFLRTRFEY